MLMMVSLACVSVAEASVCTPEDVRNPIKKNLTGFEKDTFLPRVLCQRIMLRLFPCYRGFQAL